MKKALMIIGLLFLFGAGCKDNMPTISYQAKLASCYSNQNSLPGHAFPNNSTQKIKQTTRLFINLPKDIYPDREHNVQFKTVSGDATANWVSNAGLPGDAFEATSECWSYYYEFDGQGEVVLQVKSAQKDMPDYFVRFVVSPT